jgi:hypothetical protein
MAIVDFATGKEIDAFAMECVLAPAPKVDILGWIGEDSLSISAILVVLTQVVSTIGVLDFDVVLLGTDTTDELFFHLFVAFDDGFGWLGFLTGHGFLFFFII